MDDNVRAVLVALLTHLLKELLKFVLKALDAVDGEDGTPTPPDL